MANLFEAALNEESRPLAERMRPQSLEDILGQAHVISEKSALFRILKSQKIINLIIWGPPGTGKTTLARAIAYASEAEFISLNAVDAGVKDLKQACEEGVQRKQLYQKATLLFVDEIHRFNKSQQDVLLPFVERGDIYLIGATTETPSYELNKALLSRCQVIELKKLNEEHLKILLFKAAEKLKCSVPEVLSDSALQNLLSAADGDARRMYNLFETVFYFYQVKNETDTFPLSSEDLVKVVGQRVLNYDKKSEQHYDCISAFIKAMRGSDPDAALYYCARMLKGGEDPLFIARRLIIFASEDVGNADPRALSVAVACLQALEAIGLPEGRITLGQTVTYLASCPKSNKAYEAINKALDYVEQTGTSEIPLILRSSQKGQGYLYPHQFPKAYVEQSYWPVNLKPEKFYEPSSRGFEKNISDYLRWLREK